MQDAKPKPPIPPEEDIAVHDLFFFGDSATIDDILRVVRESYPDALEEEVSIHHNSDEIWAKFFRLIPNENYEQERLEYGKAYATYARAVIAWRDVLENFRLSGL